MRSMLESQLILDTFMCAKHRCKHCALYHEMYESNEELVDILICRVLFLCPAWKPSSWGPGYNSTPVGGSLPPLYDPSHHKQKEGE